MSAEWIVRPEGLIEPSAAPEFYIDSVGAIEIIGSCVRVFYVADQMPLEAVGASAQKVVIVKIVRPLTGIPDAISRLARCLSPPIIGRSDLGPFVPRLVP